MNRNNLVTGISEAVANLRKVLPYLVEEQKKILTYAAVPMVDAIAAKAPVSRKVHYRYKEVGGEKIKIAYHPGNLKKSIRVLDLRRTQNVFVGPKVSKRGKARRYGVGNLVDAYYAHMVEYGTMHSRAKPYMRPGFLAAAPQSLKRIEYGYRQRMAQLARRNGWKNV